MKKGLLLLIIGWICVACGSRKSHSARMENTQYLSAVNCLAEKTIAPPAKAVLALPVADALRPMPPRAAFSRKSGNATVSLRVARDTLYIEATCDSLQRLVYRYERALAANASSRITKKKERHAPTSIHSLILVLVLVYFLSKYARSDRN